MLILIEKHPSKHVQKPKNLKQNDPISGFKLQNYTVLTSAGKGTVQDWQPTRHPIKPMSLALATKEHNHYARSSQRWYFS